MPSMAELAPSSVAAISRYVLSEMFSNRRPTTSKTLSDWSCLRIASSLSSSVFSTRPSRVSPAMRLTMTTGSCRCP